jgi:serine/threonine protein kinase
VLLQFLHAHSIIYCDIKPSNILLDENGRLKLGGFGLSRRLSDINKTPVTNLPPVRTATGAAAADQHQCNRRYVVERSSGADAAGGVVHSSRLHPLSRAENQHAHRLDAQASLH